MAALNPEDPHLWVFCGILQKGLGRQLGCWRCHCRCNGNPPGDWEGEDEREVTDGEAANHGDTGDRNEESSLDGSQHEDTKKDAITKIPKDKDHYNFGVVLD